MKSELVTVRLIDGQQICYLPKEEGGFQRTIIPAGMLSQDVARRQSICKVSFFNNEGRLFVSDIKPAVFEEIVTRFTDKKGTSFIFNFSPTVIFQVTNGNLRIGVAKKNPVIKFKPNALLLVEKQWEWTNLSVNIQFDTIGEYLQTCYNSKITELLKSKGVLDSFSIFHATLDKLLFNVLKNCYTHRVAVKQTRLF